jgi:hypothetical protein
VLSVGLLLSLPVSAQTAFRGMKERIPRDANTLILINADKLFGSKVADEERWNARRKAAFEAGLIFLPPEATEVLIAGRSDIEYGEPIWELAMMRFKAPVDLTQVAARYGGAMDSIEGRSAARLPNDSYIIQLADSLLASYTPANRQDVARWLRSTDVTGPGQLPEYIEQAFSYGYKLGTPIVMAMDTKGLLSENMIADRLRSSELIKQAEIDAGQAAKLFSGLQGVTLGVTIESDQIGALRVDFAESPTPLANVAKPMLLEALRRNGAMIDDFESWQPSINENTFFLRGKLSTDGTRRVLSVLALPASLAEAQEVAASPGSDPEGTAKRLASQQYYKSLTSIIDDLRQKPKRDHVKTFGQAAMWYDRYARKIDNLPILNVDEQLLDFGANVAASFRNAEMAMKGVGMRSSVRTQGNNPTSSGYTSYGGGYRGGQGYHGDLYGAPGYSVSVGAARASVNEKGRTDSIIRSQERTRGAATVQDIWQGIDTATAEIRRAMTEKYGVEF